MEPWLSFLQGLGFSGEQEVLQFHEQCMGSQNFGGSDCCDCRGAQLLAPTTARSPMAQVGRHHGALALVPAQCAHQIRG